MNPETLQRALHKWPTWEKSILTARSETGYQLDFSASELAKWEEGGWWDKVAEICLRVLEKMGLPWYFSEYWLACFCFSRRAPNDNIDFLAIRGLPHDSKTIQALELSVRELIKGRHPLMTLEKGANDKAYPPYPFLIELPWLLGFERAEGEKESEKGTKYGYMDVDIKGRKSRAWGLFTLGEGGAWHRAFVKMKTPAKSRGNLRIPEGPGSPLLNITIELPLFLATEDLLDMVMEQVRYYRDGLARYRPHPLQLLINRAKVKVRKGTPLSYVKKAIRNRGDATAALREYYFSHQIQDERQRYVCSHYSYERPSAEKKFRKLIRDRFARALRLEWAETQAELPTPRIERRWWAT